MGREEVTGPLATRARLQLAAAAVLYLVSMVTGVFLGSVLVVASIIACGAVLAVGTLIFVRRPGNVIGSILVFVGVASALVFAADLVATAFAESGRLQVAGWIAYVFGPVSALQLAAQSVMLLVFPHGGFSSTWDRRFAWVIGTLTGAFIVISVFAAPGKLTDPNDTTRYPHPFIAGSWTDDLGEVVPPLFGVLILTFLVAAVRLVMRARRSGPIERRQIEWVGLGCVVYWVLGMTNAIVDPLGSVEGGFGFLDQVLASVIPITIAVGILRYRLYEIDLIVSKTVTYFGLAVAIVGLYSGIVVAPLVLIRHSDDGDPGLLLPIVAAAMVAVLFEPIRSRLQRAANRLVYGNRASPHDVLSQVTSRLSDTATGNGTDDLARLLAQGTGAQQAVVWLRTGDLLRPDGVFPDDRLATIEPVAADGLVEDDVTESRPVLHRNELFGALTITKARNDPITPADRELLSDVAAGAGLLLRNIRLNRELEQRAHEVRVSRQRLIAAQDSERHRLERDLHDGAQQQVVALKVKLGIARTIAEREGADEIATRVIALAEETQNAVDALRSVAHGIYPPLLESEGLESALRAVERSSSMPLAIATSGLSRYPRPIEETTYFCVLDLVERARMTGASGAHIDVAGRNGDLVIEFDVTDGDEMDLTAVSDRVDAAGGTLLVEVQPNGNRRITTRLPVADLEVTPA